VNDPAQAKIAGNVRIGLMPSGTGDKAGNYTCGWVRYYGVTPHARANKEREAAVMKLVEWFGGKVDGKYAFQKMLILDVGVPFCTSPLMQDADVQAFYDKWAGGEGIIAKQASMAIAKDVISPWFGEWNETNNQSWQSVFLGQVAPAAGLTASADKWDQLKKQFG
jgi:multiple sugar transport system substrate-binding protein